jgi:hypothetical protein
VKPKTERLVLFIIESIFVALVFGLTFASCATFLYDYRVHGREWIVERCFRGL